MDRDEVTTLERLAGRMRARSELYPKGVRGEGIIGNKLLTLVWQRWSQEKPVRGFVVIQMRDDTETRDWQRTHERWMDLAREILGGLDVFAIKGEG